jgi:hypothetical protein
MNYPDFASTLKSTLHVGTILPNPGGGTSTIVTYGQATISYKRGRSHITVSLRDFHNAYLHFRGGQVSSSDLRGFNPGVFDSKANGHSSNCTMFFMVLLAMGMIDRIHGEGKAHQPYWVYINA